MLAGLAIVLLAAGYYVLTEVVTIGRVRQEVERLPTLSLAALLPPATPTRTLEPTQEPEPQRAPTRIPTMTPVRTATATKAPTPTATATPPPSPTPWVPTPTPAFPYPPVENEAPANGTEIAGADSEIVLSWRPVAALAEDEGYALSLRFEENGQTQTLVQWLQEPSWRVPAELYGRRDAANPVFEWSVRVVRGASDGVPLSPPGAVWTFRWRE